MSERIEKEDFFRRLTARMNTNETMATAWVDGVVKTLGECFKVGESVTLPGFGGFYVHPESASWVFKFNPGQRLRAFFDQSSTHSGTLQTHLCHKEHWGARGISGRFPFVEPAKELIHKSHLL